MAKKKLRWSPEQVIGGDKVLQLAPGSMVVKYEDLKRMVVEAYTLGYNHAKDDAENKPKAYSAQKLYSDRYARMRDLAAYGLGLPLEFDNPYVSILQGDLLDKFLDLKS